MLSEKDKQYLKKLNEKIHSVDSNYRTSAPIVGEEKGRNIFVLRHELEIVKDNILEYGKDYTDKYNEMKEYLDKSLKLVDKFIEQVVNIKEYITKLENGEISVNEIYEIFSKDRYKTSYKENKEYFMDMDPNGENYYAKVLLPMLLNDLYYPSMNNLFTLCNTIYKNILANGSIEYMLKSEPIKKIRNDYYKDYAEDENVSANFNIINGEFVNDWNRIVINNLYKDGDVNTGAYHVFKIDPSYDGDLNSLTKGNDVIDIVLGKNNDVLIAQTVGKGVSFNRHNFNNEPVFPKIIKSNPTSVNQLKTKTNPYSINNAVLFEQASFIEKSEVEGNNIDISHHPEFASVEKIADKILGSDNVYSLFNNKCFYRRESVELVEDVDDNYPNSKLHIDSAFNNSNVESDSDIFEDEPILPKIVSKSNEKVTYFMIPSLNNKMTGEYELYGCGAASLNQLGSKLEDGTVTEDLLCEEFVDNNDNYIYDEVSIEKFLLDNNENRTQNLYNRTMYAKTTDGKLITFGVNVLGECGHGDVFNDNFIMTKNDFIPKKVVVSAELNPSQTYTRHTTYIIDENDNLWVSGRNYYGECGNGTNVNLLNFEKIDKLDGLVSDISSARTRTVLKTKNDDLYMCGRLNGENILSWKKIDQFDNKVDKIYSSWYGTFVIDKEKNLWLIGDLSGSPGDINHPTWFKVEVLNGIVKEVCCINFDIYVIDINNNLWTLGSENGNDDKNANDRVWNKIEKFNGIVDKVWLSYDSVFVKDIHKNIWVYSSHYFGFNNIEYDKSVFNKINLLDIDVEEIYTHYYSVFIKDVDGFLYSLSYYPDKTSIDVKSDYIPKKLNFLTNIKSINVNMYAIFVLLENGDILTIGQFDAHRKYKINNYQWKKITNNGKLRVAKHNRISNIHDDNVALIKTPDGAYYATGANQYGQCGLGHKNQVKSFTQVNLDGNQFDKIVSFQSTYYGIDKRKNLWAVGDNQYGQCGLGNLENVTKWTKVSTFNENVKDVFACNGCAFVIDDEEYLWSVGANVMGGLGNGTTENKTTFSKDTTIQKAKYVVGNLGTTYVVDLNNTLWTSGFNQNGQCGIGSSEMFIRTWNKITLFEGKVNSIHASISNVYVVDSDDNLWVCGSNGFGQCGDGTTTDVKTFKKIESLTNKVKNVSLGYRTVYITDKNRELYVFGSNDQFQCGNNAATNKDHLKTPTKITGDFSRKIKKIVAGQYNAYILDTSGNVYVAGLNSGGQCGISAGINNIKNWTKVPNLSNIFEIYAGADTAYAIDDDKKIYVTGKNDVGQCGDGTTTDVTTWKLMPKLNKSITTFPKRIANDITNLYFGSRSSLFYLQKLSKTFYVFGKNTPNLSITDFSDHGLKSIYDDTLDISPIHDNYNLSESVFFKVKDRPNSYKCLGNNKKGVCGFTSTEHTSISTPIDMVFPENGDIKDLKMNFDSSMCLFTNGNLYVAGANERNNLGITETNTSAVGWKKVIIPNIFDYKVLKILYFSYISSIILVKYKEAADSEVYSYGIFAAGENTKGNLGVTGEKLTEFTKIPVSFDVRKVKYCDMNQDDINNVNSITWILLDNGELYYSSSNYTNSNGAFVKIKDNVDFKEDKYGETEMNKYIYDGFVTPYHNGIAYLDKTNTLHVLDLLDDTGTLSEKTVPNVSNFSVFRQESEVFANKTLVNTMSYVTKDKQLYYRGSHDTENLFGISGSQRVTDFTRIDTNRVEMTNKVLMSKVIGGGMVIAYTVNRDFYAAGGPQTNCYHLGIASDPESLEPIVNFKRIPFLKVNSTIKYRLNSPYEKLELDKSGLVKLLNVR